MDQENKPNSWNSQLSWRSEDTKPAKKERSHGIISAKTCYSTPRDGKDMVQRLKADIRDRSIQMKKKRIGTAQETKYQAYKQVTTYKTWPVQEQALRHRSELMSEYLNESQGNDENVSIRVPDISASTASSSSSSSAASVEEPKRVLRDPLLSPAQSRVKCQYQREFLQELRLFSKQSPLSADSAFAPALWSMEPRIFSYERNTSGKRSYVVAHLGRFLDKYWRKTDPRTRHYYEVIPEHTPCRLYLDLEFAKEHNEELCDEGVAESLLTELFLELQSEFVTVYKLALERQHVIDLDSSTATKFSRHWIVHLPGNHLFPDNIAVGSFVKNFVSRLSNEQATRQLEEKGRTFLQKHLFIESSNKSGIQSTCLIDLGVYTRNRLFRLLGSQKFGKPPSAALRIATANQFPFPQGFDNDCFFLPAMQGLLSKGSTEQSFDSDASFDFGEAMDQAVDKFIGMTDWTLHAEALASTLVVPMNSSKISYPLLARVEEPESDTRVVTTGLFRIGRNVTTFSVGASPYPMVDDFVQNTLALRGDIRGSIRAWSVDRDDKGVARQITYQMSRNRYCEFVGRAHKSNNISWTVNFQTFCCVQGCHDPECRMMSLRGTPVPLPSEVKDDLQELLFEEALACTDEADLLKAHVTKHTTAGDDAELSFEKALACLNLDELVQKQVDEAPLDTLSDDALLEAMLNNPELFP